MAKIFSNKPDDAEMREAAKGIANKTGQKVKVETSDKKYEVKPDKK